MLQPRIRAALASVWLAVCLLPLVAARTVASSSQGRQMRSVENAVSGGLRSRPIGEQALVRKGTVRHFAFAGLVQVQNGTREAVLMHVYLKAIVKPGKVAFRGVMFAESVERDWYSLLDGYVCQPDVAHEDWPGIFVREGDAIAEHPLRVFTELIYGHYADKPAAGTGNYLRKCMPYPFAGEVAARAPGAEFHLRVDGFRKTAAFRPGIILYPFTLQVAQDVASALLYHFVRYHAHLGFRVVQYSQPAHLAGFLADEQLRAFVRAGQLEFVLWDHLGECDGPPHMRCWQPIVYSHALLEAWGQPRTYLLIADYDEYFVLPTPTATLADALTKCTDDKSQVSLERYDAFSDLDPAVRPQPPGGERDLDLWRRRGRGEPHPLLRYGWRSELPIALGKDMADPDRVATYEVHNGMVFAADQQADWAAMSPKCGILLHAVNLISARYAPDKRIVQDTRWQWVFQGPAN